MKRIDINCDLGEGMENDNLIMPYITSCNISCGAHAGNPQILENTLISAKSHGVKIGAHPSYPDRENFGRKETNLSKTALKESILNQLHTFHQAAEKLDLQVHHIKPHGALYNKAAIDADTAELILEIMKTYYPEHILYAPYGSLIASMSPAYNIEIWYEAFADRNYAEDLTLIPRSHSHAMKHDISDIIEHIELMIRKQQVKTLAGNFHFMDVDTICIHGDNPKAVNIAQAIYAKVIIDQ